MGGVAMALGVLTLVAILGMWAVMSRRLRRGKDDEREGVVRRRVALVK
jgi:hypothetical protein